MTKIRLYILIAFSFVNCNSQPTGVNLDLAGNLYYEREALLKDIAVLENALKEAHPGLYWYNSENTIDSLFNELRTSLKEKETETDFYRKTLRLIAQINCGHTWLNASKPLSDSLWGNIAQFPIDLRIIQGKLIYTGASYHNSIQKGNEVISMNQILSSEIIESMMNYTISDGFIKTGRTQMVERRFGFYYALLYGFQNQYKIEYKDSNNNTLQHLFTIHSNKEVGEKPMFKNIKFKTFEKQQTAYLKVTSFSDSEVDFQIQLSDIFNSLSKSKTRNLILDLRDNRGGSDALGIKLLSYLSSDSIKEFKRMYLKTIDANVLKKHSNLQKETYNILKENTHSINDTILELKDEIGIQPFMPSKPIFEGKIYVLINGNTFSTAADVCSILYSKGLAIFVGEETGGGYCGNTSGLFAQITFPNTKFTLRLPLVRYDTNVKELLPKGRGIIPQYQFSETVNSVSSDTDEILDFTLQLIKIK